MNALTADAYISLFPELLAGRVAFKCIAKRNGREENELRDRGFAVVYKSVTTKRRGVVKSLICAFECAATCGYGDSLEGKARGAVLRSRKRWPVDFARMKMRLHLITTLKLTVLLPLIWSND